MSNTSDDGGGQGDPGANAGDPTGQHGEDLAGLRQAARDGTAAKAESELLRRELTLRDAGLSFEQLSSPLGKMFAAGYDGELTVEAVKQRAVEIGLMILPDPSGDSDGMTESERQEALLRAQLSGQPAGAPGAPGTGPHPRDVAIRNFHESVAAGTPDDEARKNYVAELIHAGANGDNRVWFDQKAWDAEAALYGSGPR